MIRRAREKKPFFFRFLARHSWFAGLLGLPRYPEKKGDAGIILIQVDGLSYEQFKKAVATGRMPFLNTLASGSAYHLKSCYSGVPSATPAFQGELFYSVKSCVPSFEFYDRKTGERKAMFQPAVAKQVSERLDKQGPSLLAGGSAYSHIFSGGAPEARYCADRAGFESMLTAVNPFKLLFILIFHLGKLIRVLSYAALEFVLAVTDFFRSIFTARHIQKEFTFILARIFACIGLRELIRFRMKMDIARGVCVISANLIGYDEQAHRRGPDSRFAHWTLRGIDDVIRDIHNTAVHADGCRYRLVIYSDHGQESVVSYGDRFGKSVRDAVEEVFAENGFTWTDKKIKHPDKSSDYLYYRSRKFIFPRLGFIRKGGGIPDRMEVTTMGPLGHVYLFGDMPHEKRSLFAGDLVKKAGIPLVLYRARGRVYAVNKRVSGELEKISSDILGHGHPFLSEVVADLKTVLDHPDAGEFVISGWDPKDRALTFSLENGAHGGIGCEETRGFVLLPNEWDTGASFLRALDIRRIIMAYVKSKEPQRNEETQCIRTTETLP